MAFVDAAAILLLFGCLLLLAIVWRRSLLRRAGAGFDLCVRETGKRGWSLGLARFTGDSLEWYRVFSLSVWPTRSYPRSALTVTDRRRVASSEVLTLMSNAIVVVCETPRGTVELGMDPSAVTGFLAWLEAAPPSAHLYDRS